MAGIVFIGDDFTGASDTLATLAERGATVRLFLDAPQPQEAAGLDAIGIATDLRSRPPEEITSRLAGLMPAVKALSPRFVHYKICSTFDSAPHVGSIGAAVLQLEAALSPAHTLIVGGQPSLGRYCVFGMLLARAPDGAVHRIDRHPIMSRHPVTPMDEADLRIHLGRQGLADIGLFNRAQLQSDAQGLAAMLNQPGRTLVDAVDQSDIEQIATALRALPQESAPVMLVGASSVAETLRPPAGNRPAGKMSRTPGPRLAVAGSRSSATAAQVAAATLYECVPLTVEDFAAGAARTAKRCGDLLASGRNVLVHLDPARDYRLTSTALSDALANLTASILARTPVAAVAVAGGDTSGAVVARLGFRSLSFVARAGAGVAICRGHREASPLDGALLLLKGGQVGDLDTFDRFVAG
ncbi:four-carbon acid sugar kinase family protein [Mesorhizobium microcysteis]|uniref:Four-carbon acid sugar kinase family protein n=1 Tax=Neoaquamicrobium microcysteis TaxID=2682781 RepID=A0A5D4GUV9_9HYPH|nr:four-carbon acid sugar kinase family protein [Mesorhizobium microcysteis]TYR31569.1 four-carbon acid sugar kinase family protein [Mesorhizobium microcysteis]